MICRIILLVVLAAGGLFAATRYVETDNVLWLCGAVAVCYPLIVMVAVDRLERFLAIGGDSRRRRGAE